MSYPAWWGDAFAKLVALSPLRVIVLRWDGGDDAVVEWANAATAELIDAEPEQLQGRSVRELYPPRYHEEVIEQFTRAREHGVYAYEVVRELPTGRRTLACVTASLGEDLILSLAQDRTAEREAQRRLEQVSQATGTGLFHWNVEADAVTWTPELYALLGYAGPEVEATRQRYLDHVHPDDRPELEEQLDQLLSSGVGGPDGRHRIVRCDGEQRTVDVHSQQITDEHHRAVYVLGIVRDVTSEVELERQRELVRLAQERQRTALNVHDRVVQTISAVVLALEVGEVETARAEAMQAIGAAQGIVAELLASVTSLRGDVTPGTLRVQDPSTE